MFETKFHKRSSYAVVADVRSNVVSPYSGETEHVEEGGRDVVFLIQKQEPEHADG